MEQPPSEQEVVPPIGINNCVEAVGGPAATSIDNTTEEAVNPTPTSTEGVPRGVIESAAKPQEEARKVQTTEFPFVPSIGEAISAWWNLGKEVTDSLQTHSVSTAATTRSSLQEAPNSSGTPSTHKMIEVLGYDFDIARIREAVDQVHPQFNILDKLVGVSIF
jgi:hypothetical protein